MAEKGAGKTQKNDASIKVVDGRDRALTVP
jgi:hypothetical protein